MKLRCLLNIYRECNSNFACHFIGGPLAPYPKIENKHGTDSRVIFFTKLKNKEKGITRNYCSITYLPQ